jgi:hypothetical protein
VDGKKGLLLDTRYGSGIIGSCFVVRVVVEGWNEWGGMLDGRAGRGRDASFCFDVN